MWQTITDCGDLAVLLPISMAILIWLLLRSGRSAALWFACALAICIGATAGLKVLFAVCPPDASLQSPSGHTSLSTLVYGGLAAIAAVHGRDWWRNAAAAAGLLVVVAIAATRVILNAHTFTETVLGLAIGAAALAIFVCPYWRLGRAELSLRPLLVTVVLLVVSLHGSQLRAEDFLEAIGVQLEADGVSCR